MAISYYEVNNDGLAISFDMLEHDKQIRAEAIEECARTIENSKTLFENHQTETIMRIKDKCIVMISNLKENK